MKKEKTYIYGKVDYDLEGIEKDNQIIEEDYKMHLKYCRGKMDQKLKENYEGLKNRTKKVENVRNIVFIKDAYLGRRAASKELYSFIVVETKDGLCLMYNVTSGEDHSFDFNREIHFIKDKTKVVSLYDYDCKDYQGTLDIGYMKSITLYKNAKLINNHTNELINESNYIEFRDRLGNTFYIDTLFNHLYFRKKSFELVKGDRTKIESVFEYSRENEVSTKVFKNVLFDISKLFFEYKDV